jgi:hypothetical protein
MVSTMDSHMLTSCSGWIADGDRQIRSASFHRVKEEFGLRAGNFWHLSFCEKKREGAMAVNQEKASKMPESEPQNIKIDRNAPAGSKNSLGAQSIRDGRPNTDDSVVEAMDEEGPGIPPDPPEKR